MICLKNLAYFSDDDLNVGRQTSGLLRRSAEGPCVPRQARVLQTHGLFVTEYLCPEVDGGSTHSGSGWRIFWQLQLLRCKPGLAWSARLRHWSRGCGYKAVQRATPPATSNTGYNVCFFTTHLPGSLRSFTRSLPLRWLRPGGTSRPGGLRPKRLVLRSKMPVAQGN